MSNQKLLQAYDILTAWLVDKSNDPHGDFLCFEDIDEDIDLARSLIEEAMNNEA